MAAEALIPALIQALGLGAVGVGANGAKKMLDGAEDSKLGNPSTGIEVGINPDSKIINGAKNLAEAYKRGVGSAGVPTPGDELVHAVQAQHKMTKEDMIDLAAAGFDTPTINAIERTGRMTKKQWGSLSPELRDKLRHLNPEDREKAKKQLHNSNPKKNNDEPDNKDDKNKKKHINDDKIEKDMDEMFKEGDNWNENEQKSIDNSARSKAKTNRDKWGQPVNDNSFRDYKAESRQVTDDPVRRNTRWTMEKDDPKLLEDDSAKVIKNQMEKAAKEGRLDEWEYNHVVPRSNLPVHY